jgi:hypothetical protein
MRTTIGQPITGDETGSCGDTDRLRRYIWQVTDTNQAAIFHEQSRFASTR